MPQVRIDLEAARAATFDTQADDDRLESGPKSQAKRTSMENAQPDRTPKNKKANDFFGQVGCQIIRIRLNEQIAFLLVRYLLAFECRI